MSRLHREIAALADGSREAPGLRERIAASPELSALLAEQERAVALTRAVRPSAPPELRGRLASAGPRERPTRARRPALGLVLATAGVVALAVVAVLPSREGPSVTAVASLAVRGPVGPAPAADPSHRGVLSSVLDGVHYPYLQDAFGWRSTGTRADRVDGRATMTVYYANMGRATVGYTIVGGSALAVPAGTGSTTSGGTRFVTLAGAGRTIVTWRRAGHTCVLSATGVSPRTLLRLAQWRYDATPT